MKKLFFLTAILAVLGLSSCKKEPSKTIVGTWEAVTVDLTIDGETLTVDIADTGASIELTFNEDGTASAYMEAEGEGETTPFTYEVKGNILKLTQEGETVDISITIEKNTMTLEVGEELLEEEGSIKLHLRRK